MLQQILEFFSSTGFMAAIGGVVSASRVAVKDKTKSWGEKLTDISVGALMAFSVSDYFVADSPKLVITTGLIAGTFGVVLLDQIQALSPSLASSIIDAIAERFGLRKKKEKQDE